jgi:thiosulfate reductase cytochrome b subunit
MWHWANAMLFLLLISTGLSMQYSGADFTLIRFDWAVSYHNLGGVIIVALYLFFIVANLYTSNWRHYRISRRGDFGRAKRQFGYYVSGIFRKEKPPFQASVHRKFNPLQKLSYVMVMYAFMPLVVFTGLLLLFPEFIPVRLFGISGIHVIDLVHIFCGFLLTVFMIIHIYLCTIGSSALAHFKSMINGYHKPH